MLIRSIFLLVMTPLFLSAKPKDPITVQGKVYHSEPSDHHTFIDIQTDGNTIINWAEFSIPQGYTVEFNQPSPQSSVLNRVTSSLPSYIDGTLKSNGHVYLLNPNGILFGEGAIINVHAFVASTLEVIDREFLQEDTIHFRGTSDASIVNLGTIHAEDGDITLIGRYIFNKGTISSPKGSSTLAVGTEIFLFPSGDEKVFISPQKQTSSHPGTGITNTGTIQAIKTRLQADGNPYSLAIQHTGRIDATQTVEQKGDVYLIAEGGRIEVKGEIYAPGLEVRVLGDKVALTGNGLIDTSSDYGGGPVLFGGSWRGESRDSGIAHSTYTYIGPESQIITRANLKGNGGNVAVWSDDYTAFLGHIDTQGGSQEGDGGWIDVSGKVVLDYKGTTDRKAAYGKAGTQILDPTDVIICSSATKNIGEIGGHSGLPVLFQPKSTETTSTICNTDLLAALNTGPVEITTSSTASGYGDITITAPLTLGYSSPYTLTLSSDRDLIIQSQVQNSGQGDIICNVGRDLKIDGSKDLSILGSKGGNVEIYTGRNVYIKAGSYPAQIGYNGPQCTGNIRMHVGHDLIMQAENNYALIGHTNSIENVHNMLFKGNIDIDYVGGKIGMNSGSKDFHFCQIGHSAPPIFPLNDGTLTTQGNITIKNVKGSIALSGGSAKDGGYTLIGHGGRASPYHHFCLGTVSVSAEGSISIFGAKNAKKGSFCGIGFGHDFLGIATHQFHSPLVSVESKSDITIRAGHGYNHSFIGVYTGESEIGITQGSVDTLRVAGNNINITGEAQGSKESDAVIGIVGPNAPINCNIQINALNNLTIKGGNRGLGVSHAYISNSPEGSGTINLVVQNKDVTITGATASGKAHISSVGDLSIDIQTGDLKITSQDESFIKAGGTCDIFAGKDIILVGDAETPEDTSIRSEGSLTIESGRNTHLIKNSYIENSKGTLEVIAGKNLIMDSQSHITSCEGKSVTIIVDHNFPNEPSIGPGGLQMKQGASINGAGPIRIYTSRQSQNTIDGLINGTPFEPGTLYTNTAPEKWMTYPHSSFLHQEHPYTIFYKDGALSRKVLEKSQLLISEMLTTLHPSGFAYRQTVEFQTGYDMKAYEQDEELSKETSSFQLNPHQLYYFVRNKNFGPSLENQQIVLFPNNIETHPKLGHL